MRHNMPKSCALRHMMATIIHAAQQSKSHSCPASTAATAALYWHCIVSFFLPTVKIHSSCVLRLRWVPREVVSKNLQGLPCVQAYRRTQE